MKVVFAYAMRHGSREPGDPLAALLTPRGRSQVQAAAERYLRDIKFDAAYHSGLDRARQTADIALAGSGGDDLAEGITAVADERFGFVHALDEKNYPYRKAASEIPATGPDTLARWLELYPPTRKIREYFTAALLERARAEAALTSQPHAYVLIASHHVACESASLDPETTNTTDEADICRYVILVRESGEAKIVDSEILKAPIG